MHGQALPGDGKRDNKSLRLYPHSYGWKLTLSLPKLRERESIPPPNSPGGEIPSSMPQDPSPSLNLLHGEERMGVLSPPLGFGEWVSESITSTPHRLGGREGGSPKENQGVVSRR